MITCCCTSEHKPANCAFPFNKWIDFHSSQFFNAGMVRLYLFWYSTTSSWVANVRKARLDVAVQQHHQVSLFTLCLWYVCFFTLFSIFFKVFVGLLWLSRSDEDLIGNKMRERGSDMQQRDPGLESNLGPLQRGQSLCTWDARSTHRAKQHPFSKF